MKVVPLATLEARRASCWRKDGEVVPLEILKAKLVLCWRGDEEAVLPVTPEARRASC